MPPAPTVRQFLQRTAHETAGRYRPNRRSVVTHWCYCEDMRAAALLLAAVAAAAAQSYRAAPQFEFPVAGMQAPAAIRKADPEYTPEARKAGVEGTVLLYVEVGTDGRARRIRVLRGLGYGLDVKAIDAMRQWRFLPGTKNGAPVVTPATIEVKFRLVLAPETLVRV
jgi:TonB family protein